MKINLGAGPNWHKDNWYVLDHKIKKNSGLKIGGDLNKIKLKSNSCKLVFISHIHLNTFSYPDTKCFNRNK